MQALANGILSSLTKYLTIVICCANPACLHLLLRVLRRCKLSDN